MLLQPFNLQQQNEIFILPLTRIIKPIEQPKPLPNLDIPLMETRQLYTIPEPAALPTPPVSDNAYDPGQCTWGVKEWRPDIPNNWGNASSWYWSAQAIGWPTGLVPKINAVASSRYGNHVALVVGIYDSLVTIKEMNYNYIPFQVRTRTAPATDFYYIY